MTLNERVDRDLADAMRARDRAKLSALRLLKTALTNRQIERRHELTDAESMQVVQGLLKQRKDSIEQFTQAGRADLVDKENAEALVLEAYLPPALDAAALSAVVESAVAETGATSTKDLGRVMKSVMAKIAGQAVDGKRVTELVRARLGG